MIALTTTSIAWLLFAVIVGRLGGLRLLRTCVRLATSSAPRSSWRPTASRTTTTRCSRARASTRVLGIGVVLLVVIVIALPLYWILEPARQAGATEAKEEIFVEWGSRLFAPTADGGFNCAGCHGGMSGDGGTAAVQPDRPGDR